MRASNEASTSTELTNTLFKSRPEAVLDLIAAVKGLHELSPQQLAKLMKDSGHSVVQHVAEDGSLIQVDLEKFARYLPLHLISVIMAWERNGSTFKYLLCGILLLHSMCDLASRVPKIEQVLLDDMKVSEQLIDLVFYLLILLGAYRQENNVIPNDIVLLHSALVACSLKLLTVIVSPQYQEVAQVLNAYYKVDIFMDASFAAVCMDVKFLQTKLSSELGESSANTTPTGEETLNHLCQQCDSSLQFLQSLCQQKLFRECIVKNKELCGNGGVLVLVLAVMNLKISPLYNTSLYIASVSRLKCKALSILLYLCEAESLSYLDEVASNPRSQDLAKSIALEVLELLKKMFGIDSKQLNASSEVIYPKGQLELNAMRLADVFSDDSNFRSFIMINFREALAAIFLLPHGEFLSSWCSSDRPLCEDDAALDVPWASYAHQRTSLFIKVIANLHCFVPDVCQDEKDLFLNKFVGFVRKESQKTSDGTPDAEKSMTVIKNLSSLLSHAESLVPRFVNEDDVQLLRLFITQFQYQFVPAASGDHIVQEAQNTGVHSSPFHREVAPDHGSDNIKVEEGKLDIASREGDQLDVSRNGNDKRIDEQKKSRTMEQDKSDDASVNLRENERDSRTVETSGSDSSPARGKNHIDQMDVDHIRRSSFEETVEEEKADALHSDEKQQRKRKRTIMNDKQIALIESALVDEPDMHRNAPSLRSWADKLSLHGAEVTTSRLKNWLNNRKARLARAAKDVRVPYDGDNLDRQGGSGHMDSDDARVSFAARGSSGEEVADTAMTASADQDLGASHAAPTDTVSGSYFEPGQYVLVLGKKGEEVGKGTIVQLHGTWGGTNLEQSHMCVVDINELLVDRITELESTSNSLLQSEKRVLWDLNRVLRLPSP